MNVESSRIGVLFVGVREFPADHCSVVVTFTTRPVVSKCSTPFRVVVTLTLIFHLLASSLRVYINLQME
jgi:hypothetical protein